MIKKILGILLLAGVAYVGYDYYKGGFYSRPPMPEGAFSISYKGGFRAILVGLPNERDSRRYIGFPQEVPFYLKETWSFCEAPTKAEEAKFLRDFPQRPGERFEAVCKIDVDGDVVVRGLITTVPKL